MTTLEQFCHSLEEAVDVLESNSLTGEVRFRELPEWSSICALLTIASIFANYQVQLTGNELEACQTIEQLYQAVESKRLAIAAN
jgi:acyl carrier protein